jgi:hypothetical protein
MTDRADDQNGTEAGAASEEAAIDWRARAEAAEAELDEARREGEAQRKRAELRVEAVRAGMIDLDGLKLLDPDQVTFGGKGGASNAAAVIETFKRNKPWLFGAASSSSSAAAPPADPPRTRHAREMTEAEWRAARETLLRRAGY